MADYKFPTEMVDLPSLFTLWGLVTILNYQHKSITWAKKHGNMFVMTLMKT